MKREITLPGNQTVLLAVLLAWSVPFCAPVSAYLQYGSDSNCIYIDQPVKSTEWKRFERLKVDAVSLLEGADEHLFDDPMTFPHLQSVSLRFDDDDCVTKTHSFVARVGDAIDPNSFSQIANRHTSVVPLARYLMMLATNYPKLLSLTVQRKKPISDVELSYVNKFPRLRRLTLSGPLCNPKSLANCLPPGLIELELSGVSLEPAVCLPKMGRLHNLWLTSCALDASFLARLDAPNLQNIHLTEVQLGPNWFKSLGRFNCLEEIELTRSPLAEGLRHCNKRLRVTVYQAGGVKSFTTH
jgi:hypothetical protein